MDATDKVLIVIGHRMGKGGNVARGIEKAGGRAIIIEGMLADMRLGETMLKYGADLGISFCGSGGAGAIVAATKCGYLVTYGLRSPDECVSAIKYGYKVLGFGFLDTQELGEKITTTYYDAYGYKRVEKGGDDGK